MNPYRYAGATLMLAGLINRANVKVHKWSHNAAGCTSCRAHFRWRMEEWLSMQSL